MQRVLTYILMAHLIGATFGCSDAPLEYVHEPPEADLLPYEPEPGKADGYGFDPNTLIEDAVFEDFNFLTQPQIQEFLERTPYNRRSFLADYLDDGMSVSTHLYESAKRWRINPLVLLTKLQVESSVVFRQAAPDDFVVNRAMGCGCHDGDANCTRAPLGMGPQIECAARLFRKYLDELESRSQTRSGWRVGRTKSALDDIGVTPSNRATAALYTYTPWVLQGRGGNWLFWNVYHRFARKLLVDTPNHHFIGGPCTEDADCSFDEGFCLRPPADDVFSREDRDGICTRPCERGCPDRQQPNTSVTFCMATEDMGLCMSRCDAQMFPSSEGCGPNLSCVEAHRPSDPNRTQAVCWPEDGEN